MKKSIIALSVLFLPLLACSNSNKLRNTKLDKPLFSCFNKQSDRESCVKKLAVNNDMNAQLTLGYSYHLGENGFKKDQKQSSYWYKKLIDNIIPLAKQDDVYAQLTLANMYEQGNGVEKDPKQALYWRKKSLAILQPLASKGNDMAQASLAHMYFYGNGIEKSHEKAFELLTKSAKQNNVQAQHNLAIIYYIDFHLDKNKQKNKIKIYAWYSIAESNGFHDNNFKETISYALPISDEEKQQVEKLKAKLLKAMTSKPH